MASRLEFVIDDDSPYGNPENKLDLATAPDYQLFFSCFMGDVDLVLDDTDFRTGFGWVATLGFAIGLVNTLRKLPGQGAAALGFLESQDRIDFQLHGSLTRVSCTYSPNVATLAYQDLFHLAEDALRSLLRDLHARYPRLAQNPVLHQTLAEIGVSPG